MTQTPLQHLEAAGLHARLDGPTLRVGPPMLVTPDLAAYIRDHRSEIVTALQPPEAQADTFIRAMAADQQTLRAAHLGAAIASPANEQAGWKHIYAPLLPGEVPL